MVADLIGAGAIIRTAFCGPCFGAGDTPINNGLSIRHTTRNFPNREGSKPANGQMSAVALMDARSIAATAANGGYLTSASELDCWDNVPEYAFDVTPYKNRVYQGFVKGATQQPLIYGPNIKDWPELGALTDNIVLKVCSKILDEVTTTDELILPVKPLLIVQIRLVWRSLPCHAAIQVMLAEVKRLLSWKISVWRECQRADRGVCAH